VQWREASFAAAALNARLPIVASLAGEPSVRDIRACLKIKIKLIAYRLDSCIFAGRGPA
jgi:hypothetical protein